MIYAVKCNFESLIRLTGAVFLVDYMLVHRKHDSKLYLGFRPMPFFKKRFVCKVDFVKVSPL